MKLCLKKALKIQLNDLEDIEDGKILLINSMNKIIEYYNKIPECLDVIVNNEIKIYIKR